MPFVIETDVGRLTWTGSSWAELDGPDLPDPDIEAAIDLIAATPAPPSIQVTPTGPAVTPSDWPDVWLWLHAFDALGAMGVNPRPGTRPGWPPIDVPDGAIA